MSDKNGTSLPDLILKLCEYHQHHRDDLDRAITRRAARLITEPVPDEHQIKARVPQNILRDVNTGILGKDALKDAWLQEQIWRMLPEARRLVEAERKEANQLRDPWDFLVTELTKVFTINPCETDLIDDNMDSRLEEYACTLKSHPERLPNEFSREVARLDSLGCGTRLLAALRDQFPNEAQAMDLAPATESATPGSDAYEPKGDSMEYNALKVLWELKASSRANLKTSREMARHAQGSQGDPEYYKKGGRQLTAHFLAESSPGTSGGYWLTEAGSRTAERLFSTIPNRSPNSP